MKQIFENQMSIPPAFEGDLREVLQQELVRRCQNNSKYSLRAFAKFLDLEPSFLSKILRGQRRVTPKLATKCRDKLALEPSQLDSRYMNLTLDHFQVISEWYHYAILELMNVEGFKFDARWIARKLGVSQAEASMALERLKRLEMIVQDKKSKTWKAAANHTTVGNEFTVSAFRKLQKQLLEMGIQALENIPLEERDQSSMTLSMPSSALPLAKTKIREFRRELTHFLQKKNHHDSVFQLSISFYPVTKNIVPSKEQL